MRGSKQMNDFVKAFFECALWSSSDNADDAGGEPLDKNYSVEDLDPTCRAGLEAECREFQERYAKHYEGAFIGGSREWDESSSEYSDDELAGHDFWLNRNRHGCGFWDGDWAEPHASILDKASKAYGEVNLYVGDDGKIYAMGYETPAQEKVSS